MVGYAIANAPVAMFFVRYGLHLTYTKLLPNDLFATNENFILHLLQNPVSIQI
ncbi:hypothetical protein NIES2107_25960 [Nostoc carneum NIES-2107]|nr:hypothetical protein NIES2107_25960 [Nostoc carneum NIES-2107]